MGSLILEVALDQLHAETPYSGLPRGGLFVMSAPMSGSVTALELILNGIADHAGHTTRHCVVCGDDCRVLRLLPAAVRPGGSKTRPPFSKLNLQTIFRYSSYD